MSSLSWLSTLTLSKLRSILVSTGLNSSGTKAALISRLEAELPVPRLPPSRARIVSVDMGIRNLAFCVADVEIPASVGFTAASTSTSASSGPRPKAGLVRDSTASFKNAHHSGNSIQISIKAWTRQAVLIPNGANPSNDDSSSTTPKTSSRRTTTPTPKDESSKESFHPRSLSQAAYALLTKTLLPHNPSTLLIERQRYRSGGAPAIQEWTVRVNMLESMLWAVLETLRHRSVAQGSHRERKRGSDSSGISVSSLNGDKRSFPEVHDVNPARVGAFWTAIAAPDAAGNEGAGVGAKDLAGTPTSTQARTRKIEKSDKVKIVASWVAQSAADADSVDIAENGSRLDGSFGLPTVHLSFDPAAEPARRAFLARYARLSGATARATVRNQRSKEKAKGARRRRSEAASEQGQAQDDKEPASSDVHLGSSEVGKLDDLADCLLQAAAWAAWEANRRRILEVSS